MLFNNIKKLIGTGNISEKGLLPKLNVFLKTDRITTEQYDELVSLIK